MQESWLITQVNTWILETNSCDISIKIFVYKVQNIQWNKESHFTITKSKMNNGNIGANKVLARVIPEQNM